METKDYINYKFEMIVISALRLFGDDCIDDGLLDEFCNLVYKSRKEILDTLYFDSESEEIEDTKEELDEVLEKIKKKKLK